MTTKSIFYPYEIVAQNTTLLELQATRRKRNLWLWVLRLAPLFALLMGVIMYVVSKEPIMLITMALLAVIEAVIFLYLHVPVAIRMDSLGLTVDTLSLKGEKQLHYLWQDIHHIRYRSFQTKNGRQLVYNAVLTTGKKVRILSFSSLHSNLENAPRINEVLHEVSRKEIKNR